MDVAGTGDRPSSASASMTTTWSASTSTCPTPTVLDICRHVVETPRDRHPQAPGTPRILVLSARDRVEDRIAGLDHGADDYLVKPFALGELTARVRALLRDLSGTGAVLRWDDIELDAARHVARISGTELDLTPKEFALLRFLLLHADEVHSAERLLEHVWDEHADPFTNTVRVTISNLRRKLAEAGDRQPIETVTGRGYRLVPQA